MKRILIFLLLTAMVGITACGSATIKEETPVGGIEPSAEGSSAPASSPDDPHKGWTWLLGEVYIPDLPFEDWTGQKPGQHQLLHHFHQVSRLCRLPRLRAVAGGFRIHHRADRELFLRGHRSRKQKYSFDRSRKRSDADLHLLLIMNQASNTKASLGRLFL